MSHDHSHADGHAHGHSHSAHGHAHGHHGHSHVPVNYTAAFAVGIGLNLAFVAIEAVYGLLSHSLTLLADAGHNLSDVLGLVLAWAASVLVRRSPTRKYTYGLKSSSILASLANAVLLLVAIGAIALEAVQRLLHPQPVASGTMMIVAGIGILVNAATAMMFASGSKSDINIRGAFLHMAADAAVSLGVVLAGLAIGFTGWLWLDPAVSLLIVLVILVNTWGLLRESLDLTLNAVPAAVRIEDVRAYLQSLPGIVEVHDLHVWGMSTTEAALTAHLVTSASELDNELLQRITRELHDRFHIEHPTIQLEYADGEHACKLAPEHVV